MEAAGFESRGWLGREGTERQLAQGQRRGEAAVRSCSGERAGPGPGCGQRGGADAFMRQAEQHLPTVADTLQGSLIVILKDSTKSTGQFTRSGGAGNTHTHTPGRAHTCCGGPLALHAHTNTHAYKPHASISLPQPPHPHESERAARIWACSHSAHRSTHVG